MKSLHATPEDAEQAFYEALEQADLEKLMDVWAEDEEIVCIHPHSPRLVGHAPVRAAWRTMLANGPIRARPAYVQVIRGAMVSVHNVVEQVIVKDGTTTAVVNVFATNVYLKGPQGWRLVLHHASTTPQEQIAALAVAPTLH